jgi:hypothetical protein
MQPWPQDNALTSTRYPLYAGLADLREKEAGLRDAANQI